MKCPACAEEIPELKRVCPLCNADLYEGVHEPVTPEVAAAIRSRLRRNGILAILFAAPGLTFQFGARSLTEDAQTTYQLQVLGLVLVVIAVGFYAVHKGRSPAWGLLGVLSLLGAGVVAYIGKVCQNCGADCGHGGSECPRCQAPF